MLRQLIRPEYLFLIGTLQAILPYVLWHFSGENSSYYYRISYIPIIIYTLGYLAFYLGVGMVPLPRTTPRFSCLDSLNQKSLFWTRLTLSVMAVFAIYGIIQVYGSIPFLAFLSGETNVRDTDDMIAVGSTLGQMAMLNITLYMLAACVLLTLLVRLRNGCRSLLAWQILLPLGILVVGSTMSGKRQGLVIIAVFISTGLIVYSKDSFSFLLKGLYIQSFFGRVVVYTTTLIVALVTFNYVGMLRSEREINLGIDEAVRYLELPLINLEYQCELANFGPGEYAPAGILRNLLPKRWNQLFPDWDMFQHAPPLRLEPTSPTGFYGELHWYTGMPGVLLFPFFAGWLCRYCYSKAFGSLFFLFCYCQMSWPLLSCHSYNHFLNLPYIPLPIIAFFFLAYWLQPRGIDAHAPVASMANTKPRLQLQPGRTGSVG